MLYAADPWAVVSGAVSERVTNPTEKTAALSWVRQGREYFDAAQRASSIEPQPLLYYYSFLNLGKAIAVARKRPGMVGRVRHGISVIDARGHAPATAELNLPASAGSRSVIQVVDEIHRALEGRKVTPGNYPIRDVLAQSVVGHRIWREGFAAPPRERFIAVHRVEFMHDDTRKQVWARIYVRRDALRARGYGLQDAVARSTLDTHYRAVAHPDSGIASEYHVIEQVAPVTYTGRAADVVMNVISLLRTKLWETITATSPYRRYYLYLSPANEKRMPQWMSIYTTLFWLGSLTRYQPVELLEALDGSLGPFFREFLETQPSQLLYIFASEVKQQDVTKAAIV